MKRYATTINSKKDFNQFVSMVKNDYDLSKEWERVFFTAFYNLQGVYGDKPAANLVRAYINADEWEFLAQIASGYIPEVESPENYC